MQIKTCVVVLCFLLVYVNGKGTRSRGGSHRGGGHHVGSHRPGGHGGGSHSGGHHNEGGHSGGHHSDIHSGVGHSISLSDSSSSSLSGRHSGTHDTQVSENEGASYEISSGYHRRTNFRMSGTHYSRGYSDQGEPTLNPKGYYIANDDYIFDTRSFIGPTGFEVRALRSIMKFLNIDAQPIDELAPMSTSTETVTSTIPQSTTISEERSSTSKQNLLETPKTDADYVFLEYKNLKSATIPTKIKDPTENPYARFVNFLDDNLDGPTESYEEQIAKLLEHANEEDIWLSKFR